MRPPDQSTTRFHKDSLNKGPRVFAGPVAPLADHPSSGTPPPPPAVLMRVPSAPSLLLITASKAPSSQRETWCSRLHRGVVLSRFPVSFTPFLFARLSCVRRQKVKCSGSRTPSTTECRFRCESLALPAFSRGGHCP